MPYFAVLAGGHYNDSMNDQALPVLYSFRRCPYAIRARLALRYAGLPVVLREVVLKDKPACMVEVSAKATVPVLLINAGEHGQEVIDESLDIMFWALAQHDPDGWLDVDIGEANALIDANDYQFKPWLDRYKYPNRYDDLAEDESRHYCERFLSELDSRLRGHPYIFGGRPSIVDYSIYSFVRQFAFVDLEWFSASKYSALRRWLDEFLQSSLFEAVMRKYPQWRPGEPVTVFGG
ncbi:MAG: glutathione S-transferase [Gammaproteobacteria bacterium]